MKRLVAGALTAEAFAPFGDVLDASGEPSILINQGLCTRFHDRATLDFGDDGRAGVSIFQATLRSLPYRLEMVERHPEGSQAFVPMSADPFLVIIAPDQDGVPGEPVAFLAGPGMGVNYHRNTWHGVLTPIRGSGLFAVVDRIGSTQNLEEHWFEDPYEIVSESETRVGVP
ncbi:MAG: ureidoglycolate lyase [Pseudomonadota bacterium]